jgi:hypothetical protein
MKTRKCDVELCAQILLRSKPNVHHQIPCTNMYENREKNTSYYEVLIYKYMRYELCVTRFGSPGENCIMYYECNLCACKNAQLKAVMIMRLMLNRSTNTNKLSLEVLLLTTERAH